jgi:hypothetical protein
MAADRDGQASRQRLLTRLCPQIPSERVAVAFLPMRAYTWLISLPMYLFLGIMVSSSAAAPVRAASGGRQ